MQQKDAQIIIWNNSFLNFCETMCDQCFAKIFLGVHLEVLALKFFFKVHYIYTGYIFGQVGVKQIAVVM